MRKKKTLHEFAARSGLLDPPPHVCIHCGVLLQPTEASQGKWVKAQTDFERHALGMFYRCPCSEYDLQVLRKEEADAYFQEVYRTWGDSRRR